MPNTTPHPLDPAAQVIAYLLRGDDPASVDLAALPEPWRAVAKQVAAAEVPQRARAFATILDGLNGRAGELQRAVYAAAAELDAPDTASPTAHHTTDLGNAGRFVERHAQDVRYCFGLDTWFCWDGVRWHADDTGQVERLAKETVRHLYSLASQIDDEHERKWLVRWALRSEAANAATSNHG